MQQLFYRKKRQKQKQHFVNIPLVSKQHLRKSLKASGEKQDRGDCFITGE